MQTHLLLFIAFCLTYTTQVSAQCTVNAGLDVTICSNQMINSLGGSASKGASVNSIAWTTSGTGTFSNPTSLTAYYTPSAADKAAGSVTLTLTGTGCGTVTDAVVITIIPGPTAVVGPDQTLCKYGLTTINASTAITIATGVTWTT